MRSGWRPARSASTTGSPPVGSDLGREAAPRSISATSSAQLVDAHVLRRDAGLGAQHAELVEPGIHMGVDVVVQHPEQLWVERSGLVCRVGRVRQWDLGHGLNLQMHRPVNPSATAPDRALELDLSRAQGMAGRPKEG